ncbi:MAG: hypothetical protein AB1540_17325 [Bdellovibrionota bacterium]
MNATKLEVVSRVLAKISRIGSFLPLLWLIGVFTFYIRARLFLGRWPTYSRPDPKRLPFEFQHGIFVLTVFPVLWSLFILPAVWICQIAMKQWSAPQLAASSSPMQRLFLASKGIQKEVALYLFGWALIWSTFYLPYRGFVDWFLD